MLQFRASGVSKLMSYPEKDTLSEGALTYVYELASQILLEWKPELDTYSINKGKQCENESIALYNLFSGGFHVKNDQRINTDLFTGEWDLYDEETKTIIDIKTAYSKKTFPIVLKEGDRKNYEWQLDCYMLLKDANRAGLVYCLVDTPSDIIKRGEPEDWHKVSHLPHHLRVTEFYKDRDAKREGQLIAKARVAQEVLKEILDKKGYDWGVTSAPNFEI